MNLSILTPLKSELGVQEIVDMRREIPIHTKYTWAELSGIRDLSALTTIVIHHDAIKKDSVKNRTDKQLMEIIANNHIRANEAGFAYHVWIRNGTAYLTNNVQDRTYGVRSNNDYTVHVCVSGEYSQTDSLTDADRNCLLAVIVSLIPQLPAYECIKGHGEIVATACPGFDVQRIREDVATIQARLTMQDSWAGKVQKVNELANQYQFMFDLIAKGEKDGNAQWAMNQLLGVHAVLKERKLLK